MRLTEFESTLKTIQDSCNSYIDNNFAQVKASLNNNKEEISNPLANYCFDKVDKNTWGVYAFHITPKRSILEFEEFKSVWNTNMLGYKLHSPQAIKKRFRPLIANEESCFYIGKSEDLKARINQHIHQITRYTTYGLKLSEHDIITGQATFSVSYYSFDNVESVFRDAQKCILVTLESKLRQELVPLIGKQ